MPQKETMQLAVFGDSYADSNNHIEFGQGWLHYLCELNDWDVSVDTLQTGLSGAGNWWSYTQFRNALDCYMIKNAVFVITDTGRLPIAKLRGGITPSASYLANMYDIIKDSGMEPLFGPEAAFNEYQVIEMWRDVFTDGGPYELLEWINVSCMKECLLLAEEHNINYTVVVPFDNSIESYSAILQPEHQQIITCVDNVSLDEMQLNDATVQGIDWIGSCYDTRTNHLNNHNNKILAAEINQGLMGRNGIFDFSERDDLDTSAETISLYGNILFK